MQLLGQAIPKLQIARTGGVPQKKFLVCFYSLQYPVLSAFWSGVDFQSELVLYSYKSSVLLPISLICQTAEMGRGESLFQSGVRGDFYILINRTFCLAVFAEPCQFSVPLFPLSELTNFVVFQADISKIHFLGSSLHRLIQA